jgi:hypothetical protein
LSATYFKIAYCLQSPMPLASVSNGEVHSSTYFFVLRIARLTARLMCPIRTLSSSYCIPSSAIATNRRAVEDGQVAKSERHFVTTSRSSSIADCNALHLAEFVPYGNSKPEWSSTSSARAAKLERTSAINQTPVLVLHENDEVIWSSTISLEGTCRSRSNHKGRPWFQPETVRILNAHGFRRLRR